MVVLKRGLDDKESSLSVRQRSEGKGGREDLDWHLVFAFMRSHVRICGVDETLIEGEELHE
jgi:hypothetical protein